MSGIDRQLVASHLREMKLCNNFFTGIDNNGALLLLDEIGEIKKFSSPRKLVCWAGLMPSLHHSGDVRYTGKITTQGNKRVRWYLRGSTERG